MTTSTSKQAVSETLNGSELYFAIYDDEFDLIKDIGEREWEEGEAITVISLTKTKSDDDALIVCCDEVFADRGSDENTELSFEKMLAVFEKLKKNMTGCDGYQKAIDMLNSKVSSMQMMPVSGLRQLAT